MNKLALFGFLFLLFPLNSVFSATQTSIGDDIFVFVQSTVRNSDGALVIYLESTKFTNLDLPALQSFLDYEAARGTDPTVMLDDQKYQVIRRVQSITFDAENLQASTVLYDKIDGKQIPLARFAHDGYTTAPGDTLESVWTFIRPVA